jgi:hypothetical protein
MTHVVAAHRCAPVRGAYVDQRRPNQEPTESRAGRVTALDRPGAGRIKGGRMTALDQSGTDRITRRSDQALAGSAAADAGSLFAPDARRRSSASSDHGPAPTTAMARNAQA